MNEWNYFSSFGQISLHFFYLCRQGTVLCDVILLNFLKGADQYKAKKFEEVLRPSIIELHAFIDGRVTLNPGELFCFRFITHFFRCFVHPGVRCSDRSIPRSEPRQPAVSQTRYQELLWLWSRFPRHLWPTCVTDWQQQQSEKWTFLLSLSLSLSLIALQETHYVFCGCQYPAVSFSLASLWNWVKKDNVAASGSQKKRKMAL